MEHLGWKGFQDLVLTIAWRNYKLAVEAFSVGPDGGRDGAAIAYPAILDPLAAPEGSSKS